MFAIAILVVLAIGVYFIARTQIKSSVEEVPVENRSEVRQYTVESQTNLCRSCIGDIRAQVKQLSALFSYFNMQEHENLINKRFYKAWHHGTHSWDDLNEALYKLEVIGVDILDLRAEGEAAYYAFTRIIDKYSAKVGPERVYL